MNKANYKNGNSKYPLSTDTLDFIQEQIKLIYNITDLYGKNYIISHPRGGTDGLIVVKGELMPFRGERGVYINIRQENITVQAGVDTYDNARILRWAELSPTPTDANSLSLLSFSRCKTISQLNDELKEAQRHTMPKGAIIMWSGALDQIPTGFALCDGNNGTPDLSGRFIVGVGKSSDGTTYNVNDTGGSNKVKLTASESGLPAHNHTMANGGTHNHTVPTGDASTSVAAGAQKAKNEHAAFNTGDSGAHNHTINNCSSKAASSAHENRPPYYALAYIMKTI